MAPNPDPAARRALLAAALALLPAACGTAGTVPADPAPLPATMVTSGDRLDIQLSRDERGIRAEYAASADQVWAQLPGVFRDLGIENAGVIDSEGRRYGSNRVTGVRIAGVSTHEIVRCGAQALGLEASTRLRVTLSVTSLVEPVNAGRSAVITRITGTGARIDGTSTGSMSCVSTGTLEQRIAGLVRLAVASTQPQR